jgi:ABC-type amino acid transport system permease subunit
MDCVKCGVELAPAAKFCQNCGTAVPDEAGASSADLPPHTIASTLDRESAPKLATNTSTKTSRKNQLLAMLWHTVLTVVVAILLGKILGYVFDGARQFLAQADEFVWTGVREGQPFHFCAVFYREWVQGGSPPVALVRAIGDIMKEGPAAVFTMALVLFIGVTISYDRKEKYPLLSTLYTTLFLGPIIGGCLLYVLMAAMAGLSVIFGVGAKICTYIGTTVPLVKEGVGAVIESKKERMAEKVVDRMSDKIRNKV